MRIGEVAKRSGVSARMLRHYESLGLIDPSARTSSGYREYSADDIGRIFHIEGLRKLGMSLTEVGEVLADSDFDPRRLIADLIAQSRDRISAEDRLLHHLEQIDRLEHSDGESLLWTIDLMRSLESGDVIQRHKAALGSGVDGGVPIESLSAAVLSESVLNAAGAMRWALIQAGPEAVGHLAAGLDQDSVDVRRNAIRALDEIRRNTSWAELGGSAQTTILGALRRGLADPDEEVRGIAALALGQLDDPTAVPVLLAMAMDGPKDIEAAEALAAFVVAAGDGRGANDGVRARARASARARAGASAGSGLGPDAGAGAGDTEQPGTTDKSFRSVSAEIMTELRLRARSERSAERFRVLQVLLEVPGDEADAFIAELAADAQPEVAATATAALRRRGSGHLGDPDSGSPHSGA